MIHERNEMIRSDTITYIPVMADIARVILAAPFQLLLFLIVLPFLLLFLAGWAIIGIIALI